MEDHQDNSASTGARHWPYGLAIALALAVLVALPAVVGPGIVNTRGGGDSPFLVQRTHQMAQALRAGAFPVRWMPDAALGLGYPGFNYYAALPYYVSALGYLGGLGILGGIKLAQLLGFMLAGGAAYGLARTLGRSRPAAVLVSAAYSYAPFHLVNAYVRGDALSEFYAMGLLPLALLLAIRLVRQPGLPRALALAVAYGALAVTHNISAMLASPILVVWLAVCAMTAPRAQRRCALLWGAAALGLGLALSAWFWLPALAERDLVQLIDQTTGYFHFAGHFRGLDLVQQRLLFDYTLDSTQNPFRMGLVQLLVTTLGTGVLLARWRTLRRGERWIATLTWGSWLITTYLMTPLSRPVWDHVPLLDYTQFPWRLLAFQALFGALLSGYLPDLVLPLRRALPGSPRTARVAIAAFLTLLLIVTATAGLRVDRLTLEEADITPYRLMLYEAYSGNLGGTVRYEFLPAEMQPRPYVSATLLNQGRQAPPIALTGRLQSATLVSATAQSQTWDVSMFEGGWLAFHLAAWPGWAGTLDGQVQGVIGVPGLGLLQMEMPAGEHRISLSLERTRVERWAERMSLAAALVLLAGLALALSRDEQLRWSALRVVTVVLLLGSWLLLTRPRDVPARMSGPLVMDFWRAPYLHRLQGGVRMGEALLLDYALESSEIAPGEALTITSSWRDLPEGAALRLELVALTAHLFPNTPAWAVAEGPLSGDSGVTTLALPDGISPGLYALRPTLLVGGVPQPSATAAGQSLGLLSLQPVQVRDIAPQGAPPGALGTFGPTEGSPEITLRQASALRTEERVYQVDMLWQSERQATRNYQLSVRLMHADGTQIVARDLPPLTGNYPTSLWIPGHQYSDSLRIALQEDIDPTGVTDVEIVLYDLSTLAAIGSVAVPID